MVQLKVVSRPEGTNINQLRIKGSIPAVVYGRGKEAMPLCVDYVQFEKLYAQAGESTLLELALEDGSNKNVLIHDVQHEPSRGRIIHIDFYEVDLTKKVTASVVLAFVNEAPAVKNENGVVVKHLDHVEIECLPRDLLSEIEIDLSGMEHIGNTIYVSDIHVPSGVEIKHDPEDIIVAIAEPKAAEPEPEAAPAEGEGAEAAAGEVKPEGEGEDKTE